MHDAAQIKRKYKLLRAQLEQVSDYAAKVALKVQKRVHATCHSIMEERAARIAELTDKLDDHLPGLRV
jgi:hypothetical protein